METEMINGIEVKFPYKPYPIQKAYMNQVLACCKQRKNGLLESPTGTGKTLSLLCSTLAWLQKKREDEKEALNDNECDPEFVEKRPPTATRAPPNWTKRGTRVIYTSRTHVQLSQAIGEMKKTHYNQMNAVVLASRDQLCLHPEVMKLDNIAAKNHACRVKHNRNQCPYYNGYYYDSKVHTMPDYANEPIQDIEDLVTLGRKHTCCPYYAAKALAQRADIIFMPYNYLVDSSMRKSQQIPLKDSVIIIDEGHNIESTLEESSSSELRSQTLAVCIKELTKMLESLSEEEEQEVVDDKVEAAIEKISFNDVANLKRVMCDLEQELDRMIVAVNEGKVYFPPKWLFNTLDKVDLDLNSSVKILKLIDDISTILTARSALAPSLSITVNHLSRFAHFLKCVYGDEGIDFEEFKKSFETMYKVFAVKISETESSSQKKMIPWTLNAWCLSPSVGTKKLFNYGIHCCIITSGTLSPLTSFSIEMDTPFPITLQNPHIVDSSNLQLFIVGRGKDGIELNSNYQNKENAAYHRSLGLTVLQYCELISGGVFLFFSSYSVMNTSLRMWKENDSFIWRRINTAKHVFIEPKGKWAFDECMQKYKEKVDDTDSNGALFIGVCRGKLSEGLDLSDNYCRGVLLAGLPYPSLYETRVVLKKKFLQDRNNLLLTASDWYVLQMRRAVNQAVGRIIRHKDDFGVVILLDVRFNFHAEGFSKWIQPLIKKKSYDETIECVKNFFKNKMYRQEVDKTVDEQFVNGLGIKPLTTSQSTSTFVREVKDAVRKTLSEYTTEGHLREKYTPTNSIFDAIQNQVTRSKSNVIQSTSTVELSSNNDAAVEDNYAQRSKRKLNVNLVAPKDEESKNSNEMTESESLAAKREFWLKYKREGTNNFDRMCEVLKTFKTNKRVEWLANSLNWIFNGVEESRKKEYLLVLSTLLKGDEDRKLFLSICNINSEQDTPIGEDPNGNNKAKKTKLIERDLLLSGYSKQMDNFPNELLGNIINRLTVKEKLTVQRVNKRWRDVIQSLPQNALKLNIGSKSNFENVNCANSQHQVLGKDELFVENPSIAACVLRKFNKIKALYICAYEMFDMQQVFTAIAEYCPRIEHFECYYQFGHLSDEMIASLCNAFGYKLKHLALSKGFSSREYATEISDSSMQMLLVSCPTLETLTIGGNFYFNGEMLSYLPSSISSLNFPSIKFKDSEICSFALKCGQTVEHLSLYFARDQSFTSICENMPSLKSLSIESYVNTSSIAILNLTKLTKLETLELGLNSINIDDDFIELMPHLSNLKRLSLKWLICGVTDKAITKIPRYMPNLEVLKFGNLSKESGITDRSVDSLSKLKHLRILSLPNADITDKSLCNLISNAADLHKLNVFRCKGDEVVNVAHAMIEKAKREPKRKFKLKIGRFSVVKNIKEEKPANIIIK
ncbi:regulator of telomere elongation helicase 1-like protein [Dinothrombium tinctorium]|uniref:Regulator of telomere elongation helicase 1-like protein n=1 Tax=Dinothrombium tinctorium TaxID=1965070 RepID=A0A443RMG4_9ACAR|nr:regulator of telomere elongation helicase 1-like protein [Dinothrombium tinctorium]